MAMILTPTTEVEAVNEMLSTIGEAPVNDIEDASSIDVAIARDTLRAVSREVQSRGWWFNEDEDHEFTLNTEGVAVTSQQILSLRPKRGGQLLTTRGGRIWSKTEKTDVFSAPPVCGVVWFFDYEDLPETARRYIAIRAGRLFQTKVLGSDALDVFTEAHENEAYAIFAHEHADFTYAEGHNLFTGSLDVTDIWDY